MFEQIGTVIIVIVVLVVGAGLGLVAGFVLGRHKGQEMARGVKSEELEEAKTSLENARFENAELSARNAAAQAQIEGVNQQLAFAKSQLAQAQQAEQIRIQRQMESQQTAAPPVVTATMMPTDTPATDAPITDAPTADATAADTPAASTPSVTDALTTDIPRDDVTATNTPATSAPATVNPATNPPKPTSVPTAGNATNPPKPTNAPTAGTATKPPKPTSTPDAAQTSNPTSTPEITETPMPTESPEPTETPEPTQSPEPTSTPTPAPTGKLYERVPGIEMPGEKVNGHEYIGTLSIPSLGLKVPVQRNWSYENLSVSPCRYSGSAYAGNLAIIAHTYHFGKLSSLALDATITFTDMENNVFRYVVREKNTISPNDANEIAHSDYDLTLVTCTLSGTKRVAVYCERVK